MSREELITRLRELGFRFEQGKPRWSGRLHRQGSPPLATIMLGETVVRPYLRQDQEGKNAVIAYGANSHVYLVPHDELLALCKMRGIVDGAEPWEGPPHHYHWPRAPQWMLGETTRYRLGR